MEGMIDKLSLKDNAEEESELPQQPTPIINHSQTSSEVIVLSQGTISIGSSFISTDFLADVLLQLLSKPEVQAVINPKENKSEQLYTN